MNLGTEDTGTKLARRVYTRNPIPPASGNEPHPPQRSRLALDISKTAFVNHEAYRMYTTVLRTALVDEIENTLASDAFRKLEESWLTPDFGTTESSSEEQEENEEAGDTSEREEAAPEGFEAINAARLELVARRYAERTLSAEEQARLTILRSRFRALMPRVTAYSLTVLERIQAERNEPASLELAEAIKRYGP
jgi:hypothetical protein